MTDLLADVSSDDLAHLPTVQRHPLEIAVSPADDPVGLGRSAAVDVSQTRRPYSTATFATVFERQQEVAEESWRRASPRAYSSSCN